MLERPVPMQRAPLHFQPFAGTVPSTRLCMSTCRPCILCSSQKAGLTAHILTNCPALQYGSQARQRFALLGVWRRAFLTASVFTALSTQLPLLLGESLTIGKLGAAICTVLKSLQGFTPTMSYTQDFCAVAAAEDNLPPAASIVNFEDKKKTYSLQRPKDWEQVEKAGADVLFKAPNLKSTDLGVTISPVRIKRLDQLGDVAAVGDRLLAAEKKKVCIAPSPTLQTSSERHLNAADHFPVYMTFITFAQGQCLPSDKHSDAMDPDARSPLQIYSFCAFRASCVRAGEHEECRAAPARLTKGWQWHHFL